MQMLVYTCLLTSSLHTQWMVDEKELCVIHYTLGPLKPWDWWTAWLVKPVDLLQDIRQGLPESLPGTRGGSNPLDEFLVKLLFLLPFRYASLHQGVQRFVSYCRSSSFESVRQLVFRIRVGSPPAFTVVSSSTINTNPQLYYGLLSKVPVSLGGMSVMACFFAVVLSLGLALSIVPRQVVPWTVLLLMYEWTFFIIFLLFGGYLQLVHRWGRRRAAQSGALPSDSEFFDLDSGKGSAPWFSVLGMVFLTIAAPSVPSVFGITALFMRLGLMVVGILVWLHSWRILPSTLQSDHL